MVLDRLLARDGLAPAVRLLVIAGAAIWRADWPLLQACAAASCQRGRPRADFEELLLQAVLFCGFPRTITAFEQLCLVWPAAVPPTGGALPADQQAAAGRALFATIYGRNEGAVLELLRGCHQDFHDFVLDVAYGRILARPGLPPRVRELLAIALLVAQQQARQFASHARGALRCGATAAELRETLVSVLGDGPASEPEVETWLRRVP